MNFTQEKLEENKQNIMCLELKTEEHKIQRTAEQDIIVYKVSSYARSKRGRFVPAFQDGFVYIRNKPNEEVELSLRITNSGCTMIDEGYHSFPTLDDLLVHYSMHRFNTCGGIFKIPAGSKYYLGEYGDLWDHSQCYVSSQLIYIAKYDWWYRFKEKVKKSWNTKK